MTLALVDAPTGLAGNMLLASLFDLGLPQAMLEEPLAALGLAGRYRLELQEERRAGFRGRHLQVHALESDPPQRRWADLRRQLDAAAWEPRLKQRVLEVFTLLAEAEAAVHGIAAERVHFHEVGAIDALVDIVGVCAGLLHFGVESLVCTPPPAGHGCVDTAHGPIPLPAPAVLELARLRAVPLASSEGFPAGELTTPTGLALMVCWAERFGPAPALLPRRTGVGLGTRRLDRPNLLRLTLAEPLVAAALSAAPAPVATASAIGATTLAMEPAPPPGDPVPDPGRPAEPPTAGLRSAPAQAPAVALLAAAVVDTPELEEPLLQQQAQIDDASAEDLAFLAEALRQAGAVEVFSQAITMKKNRQGTLVTALLPPPLAPLLRQVWWRHSTTLGLREQLQRRWVLPRRIETWSSPLGDVRLKRTPLPGGGERLKVEHEDLVALARRHNLPLEEVRNRLRGRIGQA